MNSQTSPTTVTRVGVPNVVSTIPGALGSMMDTGTAKSTLTYTGAEPSLKGPSGDIYLADSATSPLVDLGSRERLAPVRWQPQPTIYEGSPEAPAIIYRALSHDQVLRFTKAHKDSEFSLALSRSYRWLRDVETDVDSIPDLIEALSAMEAILFADKPFDVEDADELGQLWQRAERRYKGVTSLVFRDHKLFNRYFDAQDKLRYLAGQKTKLEGMVESESSEKVGASSHLGLTTVQSLSLALKGMAVFLSLLPDRVLIGASQWNLDAVPLELYTDAVDALLLKPQKTYKDVVQLAIFKRLVLKTIESMPVETERQLSDFERLHKYEDRINRALQS